MHSLNPYLFERLTWLDMLDLPPAEMAEPGKLSGLGSEPPRLTFPSPGMLSTV